MTDVLPDNIVAAAVVAYFVPSAVLTTVPAGTLTALVVSVRWKLTVPEAFVPVFLVVVAIQKHLSRGLTMGAVKG